MLVGVFVIIRNIFDSVKVVELYVIDISLFADPQIFKPKNQPGLIYSL